MITFWNTVLLRFHIFTIYFDVLTSVKNDTWCGGGLPPVLAFPFNYITVINGGTYRCWHQGGCDRPNLAGIIVENPYDPQIQGFLA